MYTHIALKPDEMQRLRDYGATLGAPLSPRQVVLHLLADAEKRARRASKATPIIGAARAMHKEEGAK